MKQTETKANLARHGGALRVQKYQIVIVDPEKASGASNPSRRLQVTVGTNPEVSLAPKASHSNRCRS
jgi:hypothetical protein